VSRETRDILEGLAKANPVSNEDLLDSALEQEERLLFERIRARRAETHAGVLRRRPTRMIAWGAAAVVVLLILIFVPLLILDGRSAQNTAANQQTSTRSTQTPDTHTPLTASAGSGAPQTVTRNVALAGIIRLARDLELAHPSAAAGASTSGNLIIEALAMNVLLPAEGPDYKLSGVITRAQYALWLWRAFGSHLSAKTSFEFKDIGSLTKEEQQAIKGLAAAGVLEDTGSEFNGNAALGPTAEQVLLERARQSIQVRR